MTAYPKTVPTLAATAVIPAQPSEDGAEAQDHATRAAGPPFRKLSQVLNEIAADRGRETLSVADLMQLMEGRARAAMLFLFAFPNVLPAPPGVSGILGLPLLYLTYQMLMGRIPWLPSIITSRAMSVTSFAGIVTRATPYIERVERMLRPRLPTMVSHRAERSLGAFALFMALVLTLPIPFGNTFPALAICLIALGVLERDGLFAIIGVLVGFAALVYSSTLTYALVRAGLFFAFGPLP